MLFQDAPPLRVGVSADARARSAAEGIDEAKPTAAEKRRSGRTHRMPYVLGALAVVAGIAGIIVKYGHTVADAVQAGTASRAVDVEADQDLPTVAVNDNDPEAASASAPAAEGA